MGFSVATSSSVGTDSDEVFYAAGSPRGNNTGAVIIFKKRVGNPSYHTIYIISEDFLIISYHFNNTFTLDMDFVFISRFIWKNYS